MVNKYWLKFILVATLVVATIFFTAYYLGGFGAPGVNTTLERFVVAKNTNNLEVIKQLKNEGFITNEWAFNFAINWKKFGHQVEPGAYKISNSMSAWQVAEVFVAPPYMKWVTITEGLRKEEIAQILGKELNWEKAKIEKWITEDTTKSPEYFEGVYFPDTYLIPIEETGAEVAKRLRSKFEEKYTEFAKDAAKQNIKWTTIVKLASIIQREAADKEDMFLISGVLWNRLDKGMKLEVDATIQYIKGEGDKGWWAPISPADKKIDSPYNTYMYKGLPPRPICNPGIEALRAAVYPDKTECIFYLHDPLGKIHCTKEYGEHLKNIEEFLR